MQATWAVVQMQCKQQEGQYQDVVKQAHWQCTGSESGLTASASGITPTGPVQEPFTPYANLTEQQVLGWVWAAGVSQAAVEAAVQADLDLLINPPLVTLPCPWDP